MVDDLQIYNKTCEAASAIAALQADLYILHTSHGISLSDAYAVYGNANAAGNALWLEQWSEFQVSVTFDQARAKQLKNVLVTSGIDCQMVSAYGGYYEDIVLRWAEVVPLWYLQKYITNNPKYLVVSEDGKPRADSVEDWRLRIGRELASFAESLEEKVVIVFSGDLSHCHPTTCSDPQYLPSPKYEPLPINKEAAEAFDEAVTAWIQSQDERGWDPSAAWKHLETAVKLEADALSCVIKGLMVLHGMLAEYSQKGVRFKSHLAMRKVPTYYAMAAATFLRS